MPAKFKILLFFIIFLIAASLAYFFYPKNKPPLPIPDEEATLAREYKIGFITDIHGKIKGIKKKTPDANTEAKKALTYFTEHMNNIFQPDFIIQGGDLIEGTERERQKSIDDFNLLLGYLKKLNASIHHVIGNHETRGFTKKDWLDLTGYAKPFYSFDYENLKIIVLDVNENEKVANGLQNYDKDYYYLSEEQFVWLEKTLAESKKLKKLIFIHYPPFETPGTKMIDLAQSARLREIFSRHKVAAVFSGHTERLNFAEIDGVRYFVLPGIERSKLKYVLWLESFAEITIAKDAQVKLFYKKNETEEYRTLIIPSEEYEKIEK